MTVLVAGFLQKLIADNRPVRKRFKWIGRSVMSCFLLASAWVHAGNLSNQEFFQRLEQITNEVGQVVPRAKQLDAALWAGRIEDVERELDALVTIMNDLERKLRDLIGAADDQRTASMSAPVYWRILARRELMFRELCKSKEIASCESRTRLPTDASGARAKLTSLAVEAALDALSKKSYTEALKISENLSVFNDASAMRILGGMYANGLGVQQDYIKAASLTRKAADKGDCVAQKNMGAIYENGWGVVPDGQEAARWFKRGVESCIEPDDLYEGCLAKGSLGRLYATGQHGFREQGKEQEGVRLVREAAECGSEVAQAELGEWYLTGAHDLPRDLALAEMWLRKAAAQGSDFAKKKLAEM